MRAVPLILSILTGIAGGFGLTWSVITHRVSFDQQRLGPWEFSARVGAVDIDPYRRARLFVEGELPLASGEGFALHARTDSAGQALDGRCRYRVSGAMPVARFWSLTLSRLDGLTIPHPTARAGFTSSEIVRQLGTRDTIEIGAEPLAGNWLPAPAQGPFALVFRFYDTALSASATRLESRMVPGIERLECKE